MRHTLNSNFPGKIDHWRVSRCIPLYTLVIYIYSFYPIQITISWIISMNELEVRNQYNWAYSEISKTKDFKNFFFPLFILMKYRCVCSKERRDSKMEMLCSMPWFKIFTLGIRACGFDVTRPLGTDVSVRS